MDSSAYSNGHVVFFHPYFRDGGVERTNIGLSKELIKLGYKVSFITIKPSNHYLEEVQTSGIELIVLPSKSTLGAQLKFSQWIRNKRKIKTPLIVISCQYYVNILCLLFRPFWGRNVQHILSERNHLDEFNVNQYGFKQKIVRLLIPVLYRFADVVIGNSKELANDLEKVVGRPVGVVYNPTINERLYELAAEEITEKWFLLLKKPIFIAVGRLSKQKGFDTLVKAFAIYLKSRDATLLILGDGQERLALEALAKKEGLTDYLVMPGFVNNPHKFVMAADVFVLSSRYEGLPNVLIEALALRTPVVATNCKSGPTEILGNGRWGKLVGVDNVNEMSKALLSLVNNYDEAMRITLDAKKSLSCFTPKQASHNLVSVFHDGL